MRISSTLDRLYSQAKENRWLWLFSIFCRLALAAGFIPSGIVKLTGERFASGVNANHPMGHYLEALHTTGYYYTFIGIVQVTAALLLLIPRTVTLGAFLYFPVILNICVLTFAVRFDGSLFTAPLMVLANLYLLGWNYEKWKNILPFNCSAASAESVEKKKRSNKFPALFFAGVFAAIVLFALVIPSVYKVLPKNSLKQCQAQFESDKTQADEDFCVCVHTNGEPLDKCLNEYDRASKNNIQTP